MTQEEIEKADWEVITFNRYIWKCVQTGKFHFQDETEVLNETPYDTLVGCQMALDRYAKWLSSHPVECLCQSCVQICLSLPPLPKMKTREEIEKRLSNLQSNKLLNKVQSIEAAATFSEIRALQWVLSPSEEE